MSDLLFPRLASPDDGVVLRVGDERLTARQLSDACAAHAARLAAAGVSRGAHVGVWTQPSLDTLVALVANAATGFVTVPLDPKLGPLELGHVVKDSRPVVTLAADAPAVAGRCEAPLLPARATTGRAVTKLRIEQYDDHSTLAATPPPVSLRAVDDAPLLVLYTSGTTGLPKGAVLTARNVAFDLDALAKAWRWTRADTVVHALPMFHVHGLVLGLYGSVRVGGGLRWFPRFVPAEITGALASEPSGVLFAVPTMYHRLSEAAEQDPGLVEGLRKARLLVSGSAALPQRDQQRVEALSGRRVIERYGLTETLINCAVTIDSEPGPGTVGPALEGIELRLVDDARRPIDARDDATLGEVAVRGPNVFPGYLNRPDATAAVRDAEGWFYTGDLACLRPDGSVRIVGRRATDLIKCGGYKVGAGEVEAALLEHPDVREAAVVGAPDADLGERIVAYVVTGTPVDPKALEDFVAGQLSPHKRPREVRVLPELPRNAMGKVVKARLPR